MENIIFVQCYLQRLFWRLSNIITVKLGEKPSVEIKRPRNLALGVFKPINGLNPNFMKNIFSIKLYARVRPNDIKKAHKSVTFGDKSLTTQDPKILNVLPQGRKAEISYHRLKE